MLFSISQAIKWYHKIYSQATEWVRRVAFPSKTPIFFFSGLIIVHGLIEYGLLVIFITHLTDDWAVVLPKAAITVNVYEGLSSLLVIIVAQLSESCIDRLYVILFTNTAFILGLGMLWYEAHRLNIKVLFGALALLIIGKAGRGVTLKAFLADQLWSSKEEPNHENELQLQQTRRKLSSRIASAIRGNRRRRKPINIEEDEEVVDTRRKLIWRFNWIIGIILATVWLSNKEWVLLAKTCTLAMVVGFFLFLLGIPFYERKNPSPSLILYIFKVVKAALSKRHLDYPVSPSQLFKNYTSAAEILPHIAFLRWLDKAAIVEPLPPCPDQQEPADRLFEVAKVKDVKRLISMLPLWSTFFIYSLVKATSSTFFYEQANFMDDHLGAISHVPIVVFVIIMSFTSSIISMVTPLFKNEQNARRPPLNRIRLGMLCSVLCCLTAWRVEVHRLSVYDVNLISVFWLTPQFFLVGLMDGFCSSGLEDFFESQVSESMNRYGPQFSEFATGIGKFFSVICILIFRPWFKEDVNTSRVDKYYGMLMAPTFLNFCFCCLVSYWYGNQPHDLEPVDVAQELEDGIQEVLTNENSGLTPSTN